ncbi:hypothetical protein [Paraflavitalea sp. CAU 1676]|uniref:plasmid mobilization protein n=1 Tax=Paraflavitalea sp. CAU 1676 TaxID=3032598 RepID=UPI0023DC8EB1|nr:hypothetical protein [Paraflavitalea sp. CAU 1676]MDF2191357.1 hypothetical protein [Paraflavitalea sp. CAU 1676]
MKKGQTKGEKGLNHRVHTRLSSKELITLKSIIRQTKDETISSAVRKIIIGKPIKVFVHDETTDILIESLAAIRSEINAIGVNINQLTKSYNTYPEQVRKDYFAKLAFHHYSRLEPSITQLLAIMSKLNAKWLQK